MQIFITKQNRESLYKDGFALFCKSREFESQEQFDEVLLRDAVEYLTFERTAKEQFWTCIIWDGYMLNCSVQAGE